MEKKQPTKRELEGLYVKKEMSLSDIGNLFGLSAGWVAHWLRQYDIPRRSLSDAARIRAIKKPLSDETRKKLSKKTTEQMSDPKNRKLVSDARKKFLSDPKNHPRYGKETPAELKKKIGDAVRESFREKGGHSEKSRKQMSIAKKGKHPSPATEFTSERVKESWKDESIRARRIAGIKKKWATDQNYRDKVIKGTRASGRLKPNKLEQRVTNVVDKYNLPYKYVGDGSVVIHSFTPDFIHCNGEKKIIEVFGTYWHDKKKGLNWKQSEFGKRAVYSQLGYKTLILWEHEINKLTDEELANKIKNF